MNSQLRIIVPLAFVLLVQSVFGQKPLPRIVTAEDFRGLHNTFQPFDIEIDSLGYVYFANRRGVFRSNGHEIVAIKEVEDSTLYLPIGLHKGANGQIWVHSYVGEIGYIRGDSLFRYPLKDSLQKLPKNGAYESVYEDAASTLHISPRGNGYYTIDTLGHVEFVYKRSSGIHGFVVRKLDDGRWIHFSVNGRNVGNSDSWLYIMNDDSEITPVMDLDFINPKHETSLVQHPDGSLFISFGNQYVVHFKDTVVYRVYKSEEDIIKLFLDSRNDLWLGKFQGGFDRIKNGDFDRVDNFWKGSAAVLCEDENGGLWFKSDSSGYGYIERPEIDHFSAQTGFGQLNETMFICSAGDRLLAANRFRELFLVSDDTVQPFIPPGIDNPKKNYPSDFCYDSEDSVIWVAYSGELQAWDGKDWKILTFDNPIFTAEEVFDIRYVNGRLLGNTRLEGFEVVDDSIVFLGYNGMGIHSISADQSGTIWFGGFDGLWKLEGDSLVRPWTEMPPEFFDHFEVREFDGMVFAISPGYKKIYLVNESGYRLLTDRFGSPIKIQGFQVDDKGIIWCYDMSFNELVTLSRDNSFISGIPLLTDESSLKKISATAMHNGHLWVSSGKGLFKGPIAHSDSSFTTPNPVISNVKVNQNQQKWQRDYTLSHNQNNISIAFDAISFRRRRIEYSYRLSGVDSTWVLTNHKQIQYTNLNPGKYRFSIRARTENGVWSKPKIVTFHITPPFWQTTWFRFLFILIMLILIGVLFRLREKYIRKKEREKTTIALELAQLEMRALKAQINPHFIFNSITSAVLYLSQNQKEKAESYLLRFSKLMRRVLENSNQNKVPVLEEIKLIQHYIELESEQFDGESITFEVKYENLDPTLVGIPPTLIQPYIENAIRHGLKFKSGKRQITMVFERADNNLKISIKDNGIGREEAAKRDTRVDHRSFGMLISSRRIASMNQQEGAIVAITDLFDENNRPAGTMVEFMIPYTELNLKSAF